MEMPFWGEIGMIADVNDSSEAEHLTNTIYRTVEKELKHGWKTRISSDRFAQIYPVFKGICTRRSIRMQLLPSVCWFVRMCVDFSPNVFDLVQRRRFRFHLPSLFFCLVYTCFHFSPSRWDFRERRSETTMTLHVPLILLCSKSWKVHRLSLLPSFAGTTATTTITTTVRYFGPDSAWCHLPFWFVFIRLIVRPLSVKQLMHRVDFSPNHHCHHHVQPPSTWAGQHCCVAPGRRGVRQTREQTVDGVRSVCVHDCFPPLFKKINCPLFELWRWLQSKKNDHSMHRRVPPATSFP